LGMQGKCPASAGVFRPTLPQPLWPTWLNTSIILAISRGKCYWSAYGLIFTYILGEGPVLA